MTFVAVAFPAAFYRNVDDEMSYCLSCLELYVSCCRHGLRLSALNKKTTY